MRAFRDMLNLIFIPSLLVSIPYILLCVPVFWGYIPFEVTFDSMNPTYQDGELVYYRLCNKSDIHENDLIIYDDYELENNRVFHRVVKVTDDGLITKGDSKEHNDSNMVKYEDVVGKVTDKRLPMVGPYLKIARSNIIVIYSAIGVWAFYFLLSLIIVIKDFKIKKAMKMQALANAAPAPSAAPTPAATPATSPVEASPAPTEATALPETPAPTEAPALPEAPTPTEAPAPAPAPEPAPEPTQAQEPAPTSAPTA